MDRDDQILAVLTRVADLLDRLLEPEAADRGKGRPARVAKKRKPTLSSVSVIRRNHFDPPQEWDGTGLPPAGGHVHPDDFWDREDEYAAEMQRPARKMGRPFDG
jgi:hypothetical protein